MLRKDSDEKMHARTCIHRTFIVTTTSHSQQAGSTSCELHVVNLPILSEAFVHLLPVRGPQTLNSNMCPLVSLTVQPFDPEATLRLERSYTLPEKYRNLKSATE